MKNLLIISLCIFILSCGKSPLLNEASKESQKSNNFESKVYFKTTGHEITLKWLTDKSTTSEGKALVILNKETNISDPDDRLFGSYLWMGSMGHGSSPIVITKLGNGIYQLSEIYFTMTGDWQLHLTLSKNNITTENVEFKYDVTE